MNALVYSSSLVAAFLGGVLALFAPCCIVSLLPTFVATALREGRVRLPVITTIFAVGVAAVLLPVVLGIGALGQILSTYHRPVFLVVGLFLIFLGILTLSGGNWSLPLPMLRIRADRSGAGGTFLLGVASGVTSACCAPVLASVVAMSALAASTVGALGLGLAYVFGMVFPLFVAALCWDGSRIGERFKGCAKAQIRFGARALPWTDVAASAVFFAMGCLALYLAVTGKGTLTPDVLVVWTRWAASVAGNLSVAMRGVPLYAQAVGLLVLAVLIGLPVYVAWRRKPATDS